MDIPQVLAELRPGEDWGPCAQSDSTYEALAATWRGASAVPTEAEMLATWATLEATRAARERMASITAMLTSPDPFVQQFVALFRLAFTLINDEREFRGAARLQEPELIQMAAALLPE